MKKVIFAISLYLLSSSTYATVAIDGNFLAKQPCPTARSIKGLTQPTATQLTVGKTYRVTGKNKPMATHYHIKMDSLDSNSHSQWVAISCGELRINAASKSKIKNSHIHANTKKDYLLALSWQASFCRKHRHKSECQSLTSQRYDAKHLSLHGLWPQPRNNTYCGVSIKNKSIDRKKRWDLLPSLQLDKQLFSQLQQVMSGVASHLQRHEWIKHGTCYSSSPQEYYAESLALLKQINTSAVQTLFAQNIGKKITSQQIRAQFDQAFGHNAGSKVNVRCSGKLISELWINLRGEIDLDTNISELLKAADTATNRCDKGIVTG